MNINKITLAGRIGSVPEANNGVVKFSLATYEKYKNEKGEIVETTQWHSVVAFKKTGELISKYFDKGDEIYIEGKVNYNKYNDKTYTQIVVSEFQFVGKK